MIDTEELRKAVLSSLVKSKFHSSVSMPGLRYAPPDYLEFQTTYDSGSPLVPCKIAGQKVFFMGQELEGNDVNAIAFASLGTIVDPRRLLKYLEGEELIVGQKGQENNNLLLVGRISAKKLTRKIIADFNPGLTENEVNKLFDSLFQNAEEEFFSGILDETNRSRGNDDCNLEIIFYLSYLGSGNHRLIAMEINVDILEVSGSSPFKRVEFWYEMQ